MTVVAVVVLGHAAAAAYADRRHAVAVLWLLAALYVACTA
jgi:hypothetical protein